MIGFAYGFLAFEDGRVSLHSHMLGVKPEYRNAQAGFYMKLAQRDFGNQPWLVGGALPFPAECFARCGRD